MIEFYLVSWIQLHYIPKNDGCNKASRHLNLSLPNEMTCPSGNSYDFSISDDEVALCISSRATLYLL